MLKYQLLIIIFFNANASKVFGIDSYEKRKEVILQQIAFNFSPPLNRVPDKGKYAYPKILSCKNQNTPHFDSIADQIFEKINEEKVYHFSMIGAVRYVLQFKKSKSVNHNSENVVKNFLERTDSYNGYNGEGTENHLFMSRTSMYLILEHFGKNKEDQLKKEDLKQWIIKRSGLILEYGSGEWNSSTYTIFNMAGWLNLYDFSTDKKVKNLAKRVCEFYAFEIALHYREGLITGAEMRGKEELKPFQSGTAWLGWLWFGGNTHPDFKTSNKNYIYCVYPALSGFRPQKEAIELIQTKMQTASFYFGRKPSYNYEDKKAILQYDYFDSIVEIGSCQHPYPGWTFASSQIIPWKIVCLDKNNFPLVFVGNVFEKFNGLRFNGQTGFSSMKTMQKDKSLSVRCISKPNLKQYQKEADSLTETWKKQWAINFHKRFKTDTIKYNPVHSLFSKFEKMENCLYFSLPVNLEISKKNDSLIQIKLDKMNLYLNLRNIIKDSLGEEMDGRKTFFFFPKNQKDLFGYDIEFSNSESIPNFRNWVWPSCLLDMGFEPSMDWASTESKTEVDPHLEKPQNMPYPMIKCHTNLSIPTTVYEKMW